MFYVGHYHFERTLNNRNICNKHLFDHKKVFFYFFYMCLFTIFILDIYYLKAKTLFGHMI